MSENRKYKIGDKVQVDLPSGWFTGTVRGFPSDTLAGEKLYHVSGDEPRTFLTHTTEDSMRPVAEEPTLFGAHNE